MKTVFREKTARREVFGLSDLPDGSAFFVRVLDGKTSAVQLVFKL